MEAGGAAKARPLLLPLLRASSRIRKSWFDVQELSLEALMMDAVQLQVSRGLFLLHL